jgi:pimeloyl-ACP methyl ester carboxylesterase
MVFGGSSGAALALEAAAAGAAITRLAVFEPPYITDESREPLPSEKALTELVESGRRDLAVELFMTKGADIPAEMLAAMKSSPFWSGMEAVAHTLAYEAAVMGNGRIPVQRFAAVTTPSLVLVGSASPDRMQSAAAAVAETLPHAELHTLHGQAHGQLDPQDLGAVIARFFASG